MIHKRSTDDGKLSGTYTVDEAFSKAGFGWFHWKLLFLTGAMISAEAIEIMLLTFLMPLIDDAWDLESPWDSMIGVAVFVGSFCGSFVFSRLSDQYGRKQSVISSATIVAVTGTITAFVTNLYSLLICRFFSGVGISGLVATLILFQEMVPQHNRGWSMIFEQQFWCFGSIFSVLLAWTILPNMDVDYGWRVYVGLSTLPSWSVLIGAMWIPESVRWYCTVGQFDEAEKLIQHILKVNGKGAIEGRRLERKETVTVRGKIMDIFVPKYQKTSILIILNMVTSVLCYYGIVFVSERLLDDSSLYFNEFITTLAELPAIGFAWLIDRTGRKWMLINTSIVNTIGFSLIAIFWYYMSTVQYIDAVNVIVVFIVRLSVFVNSMTTYLYMTEYYPTAIRTTAVGFGYALSRLGSGAATFFSEDTNIVTGNVIFAAIAAVSSVATYMLPEDTTKRILADDVDRSDSKTRGRGILAAISKGQIITRYLTLGS